MSILRVDDAFRLDRRAHSLYRRDAIHAGDVPMVNQSSVVDRQVGVRVRSLRDDAGISMEGAAELVGCSLAEYGELEAGSKRFKAQQLTALADKFGVPVSEIFDAIEIPGMDRIRGSATAPGVSPLH